MEKQFDVVVLGAGPGGYVAAIKASQYNKSVALIESRELGGVCLNWGCIPTKTLIAHAHIYKKIKEADTYGIRINEYSIDYGKMKTRKDDVVSGIRRSLEGLIRSNKITILQGFGKFISPYQIKIEGKDSCIVNAKNIIIATGSDSRSLKAFPIDNQKILSAQSMLMQTTLPKKLIIVGGGVIGCEFANLYRQFGVEIIILEALDRLIPMESKQLSDFLFAHFKKIGITVHTGVKVTKIDVDGPGVIAHLEDGNTFNADLCLMSIGIKFNTDKIDLEKTGVATGKNGEILVDEKMQTNIAGIYAIGDITAKMPLAHVASHQGVVAAQNACGDFAKMDYRAIPSVIYSDPEIATVGLSLEVAKERGYDVSIGNFPFQALGKSIAAGETEGFCQIVTDKKTGQVLGGQVIGSEASSLIAEIAIAIQNELTIDCLSHTVHAHPTLSEAWMEAADMAQNMPIHFPPKRR